MINSYKLNKYIGYGSLAIYAVVALVGLIVNGLVLDKCFVMSDDAWYLCLLRDLPVGLNSSGYLLFGNIFNDNIYAIRCACYILNVVSGFVFAIGLYCYACERNLFVGDQHVKRNVSFNILLWFFAVFAGQLRIVTCPSLNYITLNQMIMQLSLGLLLISVSRRSVIAMLFSGFFAAILVPVMITNAIAFPFIFLFIALYIYIEKYEKKAYLKDLMKMFFAYVGGMILFFAVYFIFVEDIKTYFDNILNNVNETIARDANDYGIRFLYKWLHRTMVFYFMQIVLLALALHYIPQLSSRMRLKGSVALVFRILLYLLVAVYIRAAVNYDAMFFLLLLVFYLFLDCDNIGNRRVQLIFALLIIMPVCLSFGTNNNFEDRGYEYMVFIVPLLLFCSYKWWHKILSCVVLLVYVVEFCMSLSSPTWHGEIYTEQKYDIRELGIDQNIQVDENTYARIETFMPYLHAGDTVWCDTEDWGFVELLNLVPVSYEYRMNPELVDSASYVFVRDDVRYSDIAAYLETTGKYDAVEYGRFTLYVKSQNLLK